MLEPEIGALAIRGVWPTRARELRELDRLITELAAVGPLAVDSSWAEDPLARSLTEVGHRIANATRLEPVSGRDYDGLEAELRSLARHQLVYRTLGDLMGREIHALSIEALTPEESGQV